MSTTDLTKIRQNPSDFTHGHVTCIHDLGPYTLVEASDVDGRRLYHLYYLDQDCNIYATSLEEAIIGCITYGVFPDDQRTRAEAVCTILQALNIET
jgi:hypothetical protein